jgi:hypothetical protein
VDAEPRLVLAAKLSTSTGLAEVTPQGEAMTTSARCRTVAPDGHGSGESRSAALLAPMQGSCRARHTRLELWPRPTPQRRVVTTKRAMLSVALPGASPDGSQGRQVSLEQALWLMQCSLP